MTVRSELPITIPLFTNLSREWKLKKTIRTISLLTVVLWRMFAGVVSKPSCQVEEAREHTPRSRPSRPGLAAADVQRWADPGRRALATGGARPSAAGRQGGEGETEATCPSDDEECPASLSLTGHDPTRRGDTYRTSPYFWSRDVAGLDDVIKRFCRLIRSSDRNRNRIPNIAFGPSLLRSGCSTSQQLCSH